MAETQAVIFQRAKAVMRQHPGWTLEEVAEHMMVPRARWGVITEARRELVTTEDMIPFPDAPNMPA